MILKEPKVFLIAETGMPPVGNVEAALGAIGGQAAIDWLKNKEGVELDSQLLSEISGRICYMSFSTTLNPNLTRIRSDVMAYFKNILDKGDGSVLECGSTTWLFANCSRVFTHELVRHRAGTAFSQTSGRYVRIDKSNPLAFWIPPEVNKLARNSDIERRLKEEIERQEAAYLNIVNDIKWDDMEMAEKKKLTSALRRILPNGMLNNIVFTANHRALRHIITMRTSEFAEVEIRMLFDRVARIVTKRYPYIYQDFVCGDELSDGTHVWTPKYYKV